MTETFIVNVSIHISMNEQMVDVQLHGLVDEQQPARDRIKYACPAFMFTCLHLLHEAAGASIQVSLAFRLTTRLGTLVTGQVMRICRLHIFPTTSEH